MGFSDIWDYICDGFDYIIHFEWVGDAKDGIVDLFSNLGEFSKYGLVFGILGCLFLILTSKWMLSPFLSYMKPTAKVIVLIGTYVGTFIACYLVGSHFENS
jgi:MFS superfamily sulfate permease-like transporter